MVRAIVGTLVDIGQGKLEIEDLNRIIEGKKRSAAGESMPACGLYLMDIKYDFL
jgi:tRNA pseudouridine38-40 synthase